MYYIYTYWSDTPIRYTFSGYTTLPAAINDVSYALEEIADISLARKTGARGLRAIMENVMMDTMYHVPSDDSIKTCLITKEVVKGNEQPIYNA